MRKHGTTRCTAETRVEALVHLGNHIRDRERCLAKEAQDLRLALAPVPDHPAHELLGFRDGRAMRRIVDLILAALEFLQRKHVGAHVAVRWGDNGCRPAHHVVAREQSAGFQQSKAQVIASVARCGNSFERPAFAGDPLPVQENPVWLVERIKFCIRPDTDTCTAVIDGERSAAYDWRTGRGLQRQRCGTMVAVRMRAHDCDQALAGDRFQDGSDMPLAVRVRVTGNAGPRGARIDHRDILPVAHQIGLGAVEGVG